MSAYTTHHPPVGPVTTSGDVNSETYLDIDEKKELPQHLDYAEGSGSGGVENKELEQLLHNPKNWWNARFIWQFFVLSLVWILFGYDVAITGSLIGLPFYVMKYQGLNEAGIPAFTSRNLNLIITVAICGSLTAPLMAPKLSNLIGRKYTIIFAFGVLCSGGSFLQLFAPNLGSLVLGRFLNFAGITLAEQMVPPFLTEIVPAKYRGTAISFSGGFNAVMMVISTVIMYVCSKINSNMQWRIPLAIQAALPVALTLLTLTLNESTGWLITKGRIAEATRNHAMIRRQGQQDLVEAEIAVMIAAIEEQKRLGSQAKFMEIFSRKYIKRTISSALVGCLTACSGFSLTATYGIVILSMVGVADPFKWNILNSVLGLLGLLTGGVLQDIVGRRKILIPGFIGVIILDFVAGGIACTGLKERSQGIALAGVSITLSFVCQVAFSTNYVEVAEIPTLVLREHTIAYAFFANLGSTIISTVCFPYILQAPGMLGPKAYLICGGCSTIGLIAVYCLIPETKNRTWVEIDEMYEAGIPAWRTSTWKSDSLKQVQDAARDLHQPSH